MTFMVTYREKDGALREEVVEATSRAECFAQCKARGIAPVSVKEGGKAKRLEPAGQPRQSGHQVRARALGILGVLGILVILVGVAWWLARPQVKPPSDPPKSAKPVREARPKPQPKPAVKPEAAKPPAKPEPKPAPVAKTGGPPPGTVISVRTNDNNLIITAVVGPNGKTNLVTTEVHKPIFSNPSDQLIAAAMSATMSGQMAPLPLGPENDWQFKEAMKKPILDDPDDTDEVKRMKQVVRETRQQIAELMEQGQTFAEILAQHRELWNENVKIRDGVVAEYRRVVASGNEEEARRYLSTMNAALSQMGIPPLTESDGQPKRRRERKAEVQDEH